MGLLDGKYYVLYMNGCLEGVTEDRDRIEKILRDDYEDSVAIPDVKDEDFGLTIKFDTYTLTYQGALLDSWYAVNVQAL